MMNNKKPNNTLMPTTSAPSTIFEPPLRDPRPYIMNID